MVQKESNQKGNVQTSIARQELICLMSHFCHKDFSSRDDRTCQTACSTEMTTTKVSLTYAISKHLFLSWWLSTSCWAPWRSCPHQKQINASERRALNAMPPPGTSGSSLDSETSGCGVVEAVCVDIRYKSSIRLFVDSIMIERRASLKQSAVFTRGMKQRKETTQLP